MDCLDITSSLKINLKKNIGNVLIIVEGLDEINLFRHIFGEVLHYECIIKNRNKEKIQGYYEYCMKGNEHSRVYIINAKNSNISVISKDKEYLNSVFIMMYNEYGIDLNRVRTYFVWDRDNKSNSKKSVEYLIKRLGNSMYNDGDVNGLLLLSYPSIEAYIISNFEKSKVVIKEKSLKEYIKKLGYKIRNINKHSLIYASVKMNKVLLRLGIKSYNLDNFSPVSLKIYNKEEKLYNSQKYYDMLSLVSLIFLDLGIISERQTI